MAASGKSSNDKLSAYRAKRSVDQTPEPFGGAGGDNGGMFVVHKHAATRLHWDLRLEMGGVLESWAVPKGPSTDPADKRFAAKVEAHPLEYCDFERVIPEGNYGAGAMIVWDRGLWIPLEDPEEGLVKGKLLFDLRGYKLRGRWTLVKMKTKESTEKDWLLIKENDANVRVPGNVFPEDSILSGLTVEELGDGVDPSQRVLELVEEYGAPEGEISVATAKVMLAETRKGAFSDADWVFELKYDGYRLLAGRTGRKVQLMSRNGNDLTHVFPEVAKAVAALPYDDFVIDGEVVVHGDDGLPNFGRLQKRGRLNNRMDIKRASAQLPATLYTFDVLGFEGHDLRDLTLVQRKEILQALLPSVGPLRYSDHIPGQGEAMYERVVEMKLEGLVAKRAASRYTPGRSSDWLKIRAERSDDFVIVGYTGAKGSRSGFGAMHLAWYVDGELTYVGRVGTGFDDQQLTEIRSDLDVITRSEPPCGGPIQFSGDDVWTEPELVCEVRFREITEAGLLRHPSFLRMRTDKDPRECVKPSEDDHQLDEPSVIVETELSTADRQVPFTNLDKVFWPEEGYTKGDLIDYYRAVSPWLLHYLDERPVVMTRYPDGIKGKSFFQKDAPGHAPAWIRRESLWSEGSERELEYFVCDSEESLLYIANMATIPLHIWSSRIGSLERPDWCVLDLDPKEAPFTDVVRIAIALKELCDSIELPAYVKTSGSSGLHVLVPLGGICTYEQSRMLGQLLATVICMDMPDVATVTRSPSKREGRVYIDYVQNGHGRLIAAPFCVRPLPGAPVSATLLWEEVHDGLSISDYTIKNVPRRMKKLADDPMAPVLDDEPDVLGALARLAEKLQ